MKQTTRTQCELTQTDTMCPNCLLKPPLPNRKYYHMSLKSVCLCIGKEQYVSVPIKIVHQGPLRKESD